MSKQVETYFKEKIRELLNRIKTFEGSIIQDRDDIEAHRKTVLDYKKDNKKGSYKDVESDLTGMIKKHYYSMMLSQSLSSELERTCELATAADVLGIDLELEGEDAQALANIKSNHIRTFGVIKGDSGVDIAGLLDSPMKPQIENAIDQKLKDQNTLKAAFDNLQPLQTGKK